MEIHFAPFIAGVVAGANGTFVGHPLDTLKTRFQVDRVLQQNVDMLFVRQLYRGILPPLLTSGTIQSTNFFLFENFRSLLRAINTSSGRPDNELSTIFVAGSMSGAVVSIINNPISILKIRQQVESTGSVRQCAREIYATSGVRAFYRGYSTMLALDASRGLYLTIYEATKRSIVSLARKVRSGEVGEQQPFTNASPTSMSGSAHFLNSQSSSTPTLPVPYIPANGEMFTNNAFSTRMLAAALTGMFSWCVIFPIDVIRVRLHLDFGAQKYANWRDCCQKTWAEGGIRPFYRGLGYTLLRAGPVSAASLTSYEFVKDVLERK